MNGTEALNSPTLCKNCNTPLQGDWCHVCGQPVKGMIRHFKLIVGDFLETVFEFDGRIWRTMLILYFQPGRVTNDFIAGRRIRYVLPFRLFFVLSVVTFLMLQLVAVPERLASTDLSALQTESFQNLDTVEEVLVERDRLRVELNEQLSELENVPNVPALAVTSMRNTITLVDDAAEYRMAELEGRDPPPVRNLGSALFDTSSPGIVIDDGEVWDPVNNPIAIEWLPAGVNQRLNQWAERGIGNIKRAGDDPGRLLEEMFGLLPLVLFILMPIFALLLKVFYLFKRRLYMEHMLVALHSHSFLFLALLIALAMNNLSEIAAEVFLLGALLGFAAIVSTAWIPLYLLLMQKRVYAQGWTLTIMKYGLLGLLYSVLISLALTAAALISLINL